MKYIVNQQWSNVVRDYNQYIYIYWEGNRHVKHHGVFDLNEQQLF